MVEEKKRTLNRCRTLNIELFVFSFQMDIWREATEVGVPVDIRVPFHQLSSFKIQLQQHNIEHSAMIEDLQVQISQ